MKDFRLVMLSADPRSDYWFVVYVKGLCLDDVVRQANRDYAGFEVDYYKSTEVMACTH